MALKSYFIESEIEAALNPASQAAWENMSQEDRTFSLDVCQHCMIEALDSVVPWRHSFH